MDCCTNSPELHWEADIRFSQQFSQGRRVVSESCAGASTNPFARETSLIISGFLALVKKREAEWLFSHETKGTNHGLSNRTLAAD